MPGLSHANYLNAIRYPYAIERNLRGLLLVSPEHEQAKIDADTVIGATLYRTELDKFLIKRAEDAGANMLFERKAKSVGFYDDGVEVRLSDGQTYRSKVLVGPQERI